MSAQPSPPYQPSLTQEQINKFLTKRPGIMNFLAKCADQINNNRLPPTAATHKPIEFWQQTLLPSINKHITRINLNNNKWVTPEFLHMWEYLLRYFKPVSAPPAQPPVAQQYQQQQQQQQQQIPVRQLTAEQLSLPVQMTNNFVVQQPQQPSRSPPIRMPPTTMPPQAYNGTNSAATQQQGVKRQRVDAPSNVAPAAMPATTSAHPAVTAPKPAPSVSAVSQYFHANKQSSLAGAVALLVNTISSTSDERWNDAQRIMSNIGKACHDFALPPPAAQPVNHAQPPPQAQPQTLPHTQQPHSSAAPQVIDRQGIQPSPFNAQIQQQGRLPYNPQHNTQQRAAYVAQPMRSVIDVT